VAECVSEAIPVPVRRVGIPDVFCRSGDPAELFPEYGMSAAHIAAAARAALAAASAGGKGVKWTAD
jgi:transketolase